MSADALPPAPPPAAAPKWAIVTLVTTDSWCIGAEVLLHSLKANSPPAATSNSNTDKVVLVTADVSASGRARLGRVGGVAVIEVEPLSMEGCPSTGSKHVKGWAAVGYTKLRIWGLTQYQKVLYIDADCLVVDSGVQALFERDVDFAAAPDVFPPDHFNAGVLLIRPDEAVLADMIAKIPELPSYDGGDTGFLNAYFPDWYTRPAAARLPFGYNAQRTLYWMTHEKAPGYWDSISPLKIIHFSSSPKPWEEGRRKGDLEMQWWLRFVSVQSSDTSMF